jgi:hypothetical protein
MLLNVCCGLNSIIHFIQSRPEVVRRGGLLYNIEKAVTRYEEEVTE